jgi:hypothetical protein
MDFTIDIQLTQATRDQLRYLTAKVDDQKAVVGCRTHDALIGLHESGCKPESCSGCSDFANCGTQNDVNVAFSPEETKFTRGGSENFNIP